jgi:cell division FtsZ-interacting protein ZapD
MKTQLECDLEKYRHELETLDTLQEVIQKKIDNVLEKIETIEHIMSSEEK